MNLTQRKTQITLSNIFHLNQVVNIQCKISSQGKLERIQILPWRITEKAKRIVLLGIRAGRDLRSSNITQLCNHSIVSLPLLTILQVADQRTIAHPTDTQEGFIPPKFCLQWCTQDQTFSVPHELTGKVRETLTRAIQNANLRQVLWVSPGKKSFSFHQLQRAIFYNDS